MKSPHAVSRAYSFIKELEAAGFGDVQAVRDFRNELQEAKNENEKFPQYATAEKRFGIESHLLVVLIGTERESHSPLRR